MTGFSMSSQCIAEIEEESLEFYSACFLMMCFHISLSKTLITLDPLETQAVIGPAPGLFVR